MDHAPEREPIRHYHRLVPPAGSWLKKFNGIDFRISRSLKITGKCNNIAYFDAYNYAGERAYDRIMSASSFLLFRLGHEKGRKNWMS